VVANGHYFSNVSPPGVADIVERTRAGLDNFEVKTDERIFPVDVSCARCNHSLMDPDHPVDGRPSSRVTFAYDGIHGRTRLSSLYGSHNVESDQEIRFFCPHCHAHLTGSSNCPECGSVANAA
jgi:Zn finger protein HypA/HybF involved in hydrogenase expression